MSLLSIQYCLGTAVKRFQRKLRLRDINRSIARHPLARTRD